MKPRTAEEQMMARLRDQKLTKKRKTLAYHEKYAAILRQLIKEDEEEERKEGKGE